MPEARCGGPPLRRAWRRRANVLGQPDALRDPLRHFAMTGENRNADLHGLGEALLDGVGQGGGRRFREQAREGAHEGLDDVRMAAHVDAGEILAQRNLVAERRGQQVGVGVAADVAKQGLVIHLAAQLVVKASDLRQPHRQHAGSQREIPRLAGRQVGRIGQRHQEVGAAKCRCRHSRPLPVRPPRAINSP